MKKTLLSLFFLSSALALSAQQEFAPIGAVWHYTQLHIFSPQISFFRVESVGDTVIMDRPCRKLEGFFFFNFTGTGKLFTHQQGDSVWFYNPSVGDFEILYYFNAEPGYTWSHNMGSPGSPYAASRQYHVDSTSSVIINGQTLKRLHITESTEGLSYRVSDIVETIGSLFYMMYSFYLFTTPLDIPYPAGLRCYYDPEFGLYETGQASSCEAVPVREPLAEPEGVRIFPNPAAGAFTVENLRAKPVSFDVIDLHGRTVWRGQSAGARTEVPAGHLAAGMYHLVFREGSQWIGRLRVVVD